MDKNKRLQITLELIWWVVTLVVVVGVLFPINNAFKDYPFWATNILFIVVFITYTRYIFLLKHSLFAYYFPIKLVLVFVSLPLVFYMISSILDFQSFLDDEGQDALLQPFLLREQLSREAGTSLTNYVKNEMFFFAVGAIIAAMVLPIRMVVSIWRTKNRGTV